MSSSYKKKTAINIFSSSSLAVFKILMSFLTRIIFLRVLSDSYLGINALFSNILSVLSLADLGLTSVMTYSLYEPLAKSDTEKIKSIVNYFKKIYLSIALIIFLIGCGLIPFLPYIINLENEIPGINIYYLIALASTSVSYLYVYRSILISADQKQYAIDKISMLFRFILFFVNVFVLIKYENYTFYLLSTFFVSLTMNFTINLKAKQMYPYLKEKTEDISSDDKEKIKSHAKSMFIYKASSTAIGNIDNILISILIGTIAVGIYSNYVMIISHVALFINIIFNQLAIMFGNKFNAKNYKMEDAERHLNILLLINFWIVAFCSISFIVLFNSFITLVFGPSYVMSIFIVCISAINFYVDYMRRSINVFENALGMFNEIKYIRLATAILNVFFSVVLGCIFGIEGILVATLIANLSYSFWKEPQLLYNLKFKKESINYFYKYITFFILFLIALGITYTVSSLISFNILIVDFLIDIILCVLIPNIVFFTCFKNNNDFKNGIKMMVN